MHPKLCLYFITEAKVLTPDGPFRFIVYLYDREFSTHVELFRSAFFYQTRDAAVRKACEWIDENERRYIPTVA